jgi:hypothetical protein
MREFLEHFFSWQNVLNAALWRLIWSLAFSVTMRSAIKWLFQRTLERRQEIAFWLIVPTALFLGLLALSYASPTYQIEILGEQLTQVQSSVNKLRQAQLPRHLTQQQIAIAGKSLGPLKGQTIVLWCPVGDNEACSYASDFLLAFDAAGVKVAASQSTFLTQGIGILVMDPNHPPTEAQTLLAATAAAGVQAPIVKYTAGNLPTAAVFYVGHKLSEP